MNKKIIFCCSVLLILAYFFLAGFIIGQKYPQKLPVEKIKRKVDTLFIRDTMMSCKPIYVDRVQLDSVLVPVVDSVKIHDTTFVYLEREKVSWRDSSLQVLMHPWL